MRRLSLATSVLFLAAISTANAATDQECQSLWKTLDVDANGALVASEDNRGYIAAIEKSTQLIKPGVVSRDEFLSYCKASITDVNTESPANTKDIGKGDLTPGKNPLSQADAQKKLEASGYKNVRELKLDAQGIWRGVADGDVQGKHVAVDPQGDIMAEKNQAPPTKSDAGQSSGGSVQPAGDTASGNQRRNSELAIDGGKGSTSGLFLWMFLLLGNALGLLFLSNAGGKTTAMTGIPGVKRMM